MSGRIDRDVRDVGAADPSKKKSGQIVLADGNGSQFQQEPILVFGASIDPISHSIIKIRCLIQKERLSMW
jgi:hypothetical protein